VVQDAFVALSRQKSGTVGDPKAWLFRVVRHGAINAGIAAKRRQRHEAAAGERHGLLEKATEGALDPEAASKALEGLPESQREVIVARVWGALTFEQIASLVGVSTSQAHRLYQTGLETLRTRLGVSCRATTTTDRSTPR
jgi:RNA polymerase sigma factor (sigma-70 family)